MPQARFSHWKVLVAGNLVVGLVLSAASTPLLAQEPEKTAAETFPIALLNLDLIAQTYKPFQQKVTALRAEAVELQTKVGLRQTELENVQVSLRKTKQGTPDFQKLQAEFAKLQMELQVFVQEEQQKLQQKDRDISLELHRQVDAVLKVYCKAKGIRMVVRQQNSSLDEKQSPQDVLKALGRGVLYDDGLDITGDVLKALDEKSAGSKKE